MTYCEKNCEPGTESCECAVVIHERTFRGVRCVVCDDRGCEFCPRDREPADNDEHAARRQDRLDSLTGTEAPVWDGEAGAAGVRLLCGVAGAAVLALAVWAVWPYLVGAGVIVAGWRVVTRHTRRRRPRSSWSSLGRTAAMMYAAWNSRWLRGSTFKASVPAAAGREHVCGECGRDDTVPF